MVEVIFEHQGILDKYIGDAIMAVFGAPLSTASDADNAVKTAVRMQQVLAGFNARRAAAGLPPVDVRIGVNSDEVIAGNIGSTRRMDYTVVGDGVNLAARLESANKVYGTSLLVSASTMALLRDCYHSREIDLLRVKGRAQPVAIHEVFATEPDSALLQSYAAGLAAYRRGEWSLAVEAFDAALRVRPDDTPSSVMRARALSYADRLPPIDWDGVYSAHGK